ncbi:MAG: PAS domain S-box protein [Candidatus Ratteibacteria bacterium]|nr:PAS domain S-box protein [Candidatus Ratteibacteria bacterium]
MDIENKTKEELIKEIELLRDRISKLQESGAECELMEKQCQNLVQKGKDIMFMLDADGYIKFISPLITEILGYTQDELVNRDVGDFVFSRDKNKTDAAFNELLKTGELTTELTFLDKKGQTHLFECYAGVIKENNQILGIRGIVRDITKRKKVEEELQETKRQIEFVLGHTKTGLDIIDSKFNIRYIDPEWQKVYGDPKGKKCYEYFMDRKEACPHCGIVKAFATKETVVTEEVLVKENNRPVQVTTIPFQDKNGEWLVAEVNVDITERKQMEKELDRYRKYLEDLVRQRTEELKTINEKLAEDISRREKTEQELRESEKRYKNLWDEAPVAYHTLDTKGIITSVNKTEANMLGYKPKDMLGKSIFDFILPEQREEAKKRFHEKLTGKHLAKAERRIYVGNDGSNLYVSIDDVLERDNNGEIIGIKTTMVDVTESKKMEDALRESELQYKTTINSMRDAIYVVDADLRIILCNKSLQRWLQDMGLKAEVSGKILFDVIPFFSDKVRNEYRQVFESGEILTTEEHVNFGGKEWVTEVRKIPIEENNKIVRVLTIIRDVTDRKKTEETIRHLAYHDILTNLPNRTLFNNRLALELNRAQRNKQKVSVMLMDLDRFKNVNDSLGHSFGDQLLQSVGKRLSEIVRSSDTVARMSGDEFILLLPETPHIRDVTKIAKKILKAIKKPFLISGKELNITTSIGISIYPTHGEDAETLIKNADIAMYQAKKSGRNKYIRYTANSK